MSKTIDERVVEMRFDNKNFESNVKDTMTTLDKFKQSLNFNGATKGLENIESASKKVTMTGLSSAVETIQNKFSAMEVIGITALANLTNQAVNYGKNLAAAFTVVPVRTGFEEYELKMGSVQTIMASTGESLAKVNEYLDELNVYSDKTIYSFSDMTTNIGKFTNAGVKLQDAVLAIKGVSNEAAVSGANANEASRAMYNFAQALSAGYVKLIDWKSIENANMATVEFKNYLLEAAAACGTVEKQADGMYKILTTNASGSQFDQMVDATHNFNDSLTYQWMTTEALVNTLKDYADETTEIGKKAYASAQDVKTFSMLMDTLKEAAQSGWAQTWELTIGDFEQAKTLWTEAATLFGGIIDASSNARNSVLENALSSKWDVFIKQINEAGVSTDEFTEKLKETARQHNIAIDGLIEKEGSLAAVFEKGKLSVSIIIETLKKFANAETTVSTTTEKVTGKLEDFQKVVNQVIRGDFKDGKERVEALTEAGYDNVAVQTLVNKVWERNGKTWSDTTITADDLTDVIKDMSTAEIESIGYTEEQATKLKELAKQAEETGTPLNELINSLDRPSGRESVIDSLRVSIQSLVRTISAIKDAWDSYFSIQPSDITAVIDAFYDLTHFLEITEEDADKLRRTFKGLFALLDIVTTFIGGGVKIAFKLFCKLIGMADIDVLEFTATIGDNLVAFHDWLLENNRVARGLSKLIEWFGKGIDKCKEWYGEFKNLPVVVKGMERVESTFEATTIDMSNHFADVIGRINEFIDRVKAMDSITIDDIDDILKDFFENVIQYAFDIDGKFTELRASIKAFKEDIKAHFEEAGTDVDKLQLKIINFFESVKERFSEKIGLGEILTIGLGVGLIASVKKLSKIFKPILNIAGGIDKILGGVSSVLGSLSKMLDTVSLEIKSKAVFKMAQSILVLALSVAILANVPSDRLTSAVKALGILTACLLALSGAVAVLTKIGALKPKEATQIAKASTVMLAISASLLMIVGAMKLLDGMDSDAIATNFFTMFVFAAGMISLVTYMSGVTEQLSKGSKVFLSIAVSLIILTGAIAILGRMDAGVLEQGTSALFSISAVLAVIMTLTRILGKNSDKGTKSITAICASLVLLAKAVKIFGEMDLSTLVQGAIAATGFMIAVSVLMNATHNAGGNALKAGVSILAISTAAILFAAAVKVFGSMDLGTLTKGILIVGLLTVFMRALVTCTKSAGENAAKAGVTLIAMAGSIMLLSVAMLLLEHVSWDGIKKGLVAIGSLTAFFATLIIATKLAQSCEKTLIVLAVTIGILAVALGALSMIDTEHLKGAATALSEVMFLTAIVIGISHFAPTAISGLVVIEVLLVTLAVVLGSLAQLPVNDVKTISDSLCAVLLSLSAALVLMAATGSLGPAAFLGITSLLVLIGALTGVISGFAALNKFVPDLQEFLDGGIVVLGKIGEGLGSFVGGIVNGVLTETSKSLPAIGDNLSAFMQNAMPFIYGAKKINSEVVDGVKSLAEAMLIITATDILTGIANFFGIGGSSMVDFGKEIAMFAPYMKRYSDAIIGIDPEAVSASATAAKSLSELANNLPNSGGLIGKILGENDIDIFGEKLVPFGKALQRYSLAVKGIDADAVTNSATAAQSLSELANNLPNSGGWIGAIFGENDIDTFGSKLVPFGKYLKDYSSAVSGLEGDVITNSVNAAKSVSELAENLPNSGGIVSWFTGNNDINVFGESLKSFGESFASYASQMESVDTEVVTQTTAAAKSIVELENVLPEWLTGRQSLTNFGLELSMFGSYLKTYAANISDIKVYHMHSISSELEKLVGIASGMTDLTTGNMSAFGESMMSMANSGIDDFILAFTNSYSKVSESIPVIATYTADAIEFAFTTKYFQFYNIGSDVIIQLSDGMKGQSYNVIAACNHMIKLAVAELRAHYQESYNAGSYFAGGFVNGISDSVSKAAKKAAEMAKAASDAANKTLDIHSPSKVGYKTGSYYGMGFVNAIVAYASKAYDASKDMAIQARTGLTDVIERVQDVFMADTDVQPVIRPVVDMTEVEQGAQRINAAFSRSQAITAGSSVNTRLYGDSNSDDGKPIPYGGIKTFTFTQNNYSPKALSRDEIYRQTNNQLSTAKKELGIV